MQPEEQTNYTVEVLITLNKFGTKAKVTEEVIPHLHRWLYQEYGDSFALEIQDVTEGATVISPFYEDQHDEYFWIPKHKLVKREAST